MKVLQLISGGKDSIFSMMHCAALGHNIVALGNLYPPHVKTPSAETGTTSSSSRTEVDDALSLAMNDVKVEAVEEELDSWMFQSVGHSLIPLIAECLADFSSPGIAENKLLDDLNVGGIKRKSGGPILFRLPILGKSIETGSTYQKRNTPSEDNHDEVEDLDLLVQLVLNSFPDLEAISSGAIMSSYQRIRIENICARYSLVSLSPLWWIPQDQLLQDMCFMNLQSILIKVAAEGLNATHLGKTLQEVLPTLVKLNKLYDVHLCGEGGEYETITLDSPIFTRKRIEISEISIIEHGQGVWYELIRNARIVKKPRNSDEGDDIWLGNMKDLIRRRYLLQPCLEKYEIDIPSCKYLDLLQSKQQLKNRRHPANFSIHVSDVSQLGFFSISGTSSSKVDDINGTNTNTLAYQTREILNGFKEYCSKINLDLARNSILITVYVRDISQFGVLNDVYSEFFGVNPPARVTVETSISNQLQIDLLGFVNSSNRMEHLHVRGSSYWAPANIGPYSQAVRAGHLVWMAGMIGLIPITMQLPTEGNENDITEYRQSIFSVANVARVFGIDNDISKGFGGNCMQCVCYLSPKGDLQKAKEAWHERTIHEEGDIPLPVYIYVSRLPKDALIEWHLVFFSSVGWQEIQSLNPDFDPSNSRFTPAAIHSAFNIPDGKVNQIERGNSLFSQAMIKDAGKSIAEILKSTIRILLKEIDSYTVVSARCFYLDSLDTDGLLDAPAEFKAVAITFVPVLLIEDSDYSIALTLFSERSSTPES